MKPSVHCLRVVCHAELIYFYLVHLSTHQHSGIQSINSLLQRSPNSFQKSLTMHISFVVTTLLVGLASAQSYPECTREVARSDDCAAVINANACYNKFRWNAQTLTCIDGNDNAVKQKKASISISQYLKLRANMIA
jgi:hypothetical protein